MVTGVALLEAIAGALLSALWPRAGLVAENLALRQQLAVLRVGRRPRLRPIDRAFWVLLSRVWSRWVDVLVIVKPATVIGWHRHGFARFWAYKSRRRGSPPVASEVIELIVRMAHDNPTWSRRRIAAELAKLGHDVARTPWRSTCPARRDALADHGRRPGGLSSDCTWPARSPLTFSPCRPRRFARCTSSSCCRSSGAFYCTSTLRHTRTHPGQRSRWWRPSRPASMRSV
jgi:hypothetical protein